MEEFLISAAIFWVFGAFVIGTVVGSFLNVLIARLPYEKSIIWPGSRCFACFTPIRPADNVPILGYFRLRGKCRACGATYSARYLWVEVFTGLAFVGLFAAEVLFQCRGVVNLEAVNYEISNGRVAASFSYHAVLISLLIAASVIDAKHRIIPPAIAYSGTLLGLFGAVLLPWPWPLSPSAVNALQARPAWTLPEDWGRIPIGVQPWPFWGPLPDWAPAGSWQLGLMNGLLGALAGTFLVRAVKALFEVGLGREALGLGDADLLMMSGAFLGWQPVTVSLFVGAFAALAIKLPLMLIERLRGVRSESELPFGPGLALGVVISWLSWPWLGRSVQFLFFDHLLLGVVVVIMGGGMLAAGLLLRKGQ